MATSTDGVTFARVRAAGFKGAAVRLADVDLPRIGALIGVGEDELHAVIDVESSGSGFDKLGRPKMLFEPHVFWRHLGAGAKRDRAASLGIAYAKWKPGNYPSDSYPRLAQAMDIDVEAALKSASWGLTQILGENHVELGYLTAADMVVAFCGGEAAHLAGTVALIRSKGLAGKLKAHDWAAVARGWNGPGYAANRYDDKLAAAFAKWNRIPDTPWSPTAVAPIVGTAPVVPVAVPAAVPAVGFWARVHAVLSQDEGGLMPRTRFRRVRLGILRWYAAARGYRIYALALVLAVPDILDALAGVDFTVLLPPGWGAKSASILAILRVVLGIVIRRMAMVGPPGPPAGGPR